MLGFLRRNLRSCSEETKANAYFSMVRSKFKYCSAVWSPNHKDQIRKIEMVQRRAARYTTNHFRNTSSVSSMLDHLQWESLESRRSKIQLTILQSDTQPDRHTSRPVSDAFNIKDKSDPLEEIQTLLTIYRLLQI